MNDKFILFVIACTRARAHDRSELLNRSRGGHTLERDVGKKRHTGTVTAERSRKRSRRRRRKEAEKGGGSKRGRERGQTTRQFLPCCRSEGERARGQGKWSTVVFIPIEASLCQGCFSTVPSRADMRILRGGIARVS